LALVLYALTAHAERLCRVAVPEAQFNLEKASMNYSNWLTLYRAASPMEKKGVQKQLSMFKAEYVKTAVQYQDVKKTCTP